MPRVARVGDALKTVVMFALLLVELIDSRRVRMVHAYVNR
jgi:hypothetical protein